MWIRTQDKMALMNATTIRMYYDGTKFWRIYCDQKCIAEEYTNLGTYSTKEKALKVLDKIQSAIIRTESIYAHEYSGSGVRDCDVFQMPQDSEV